MMALGNSETGYGWVAKILHWVMFVLLVMVIWGGLTMSGLPDGPEKYGMIGDHKSMGALILILGLIRLGWRLVQPRPKVLENANPLEEKVSHVVHGLLYLLMLAQPLSGALMSQAAGYGVEVFGLFTLPTLVGKSEELGGIFHEVHEYVWIALVVMVAVHVAAALKHQFILKDNLMRKMTWGD